jgi:hypothetical protein
VKVIHGLVKIANGHHILHWTLGGVYYFTDDKGNWISENKNLKIVEECAMNTTK